MFGVFSLGYEVAYVSEVIAYDEIGPTVLECFLYWVQSAMFVPGTFEIPRVSAATLPAHDVNTTHTLQHAWNCNLRAVDIIRSAQ